MHIKDYKNTRGATVETLPAPSVVKISLAQHSGAPMKPAVKAGDYVYLGQPISTSSASISCPVHASVSGVVRGIETVSDAGRASPVEAVVIENDYKDSLYPGLTEALMARVPAERLTAAEVIEITRQAGIVGLGGAVFPTYKKIEGSVGKVRTIFVNGAECEPFITADHRTMLEQPRELIGGIEIVMRAVGCEKAVIAIEDNKADAAELLRGMTADREGIEVRLLKTKYPQGEKSQIIYALTGVEPTHGVRLADAGFMIINVGTCVALYRACTEGIPLTERIVTVDGDCVRNPKNVLVRIGTPVREVIDFCGGLKKPPAKLIAGGPMMGDAQWNMNGTVNKGTSALLAFSEGFGRTAEHPSVCINCGRCVKYCPMRLMPNYLARLARAKKYSECEDYNISDCVECGTCSYNCPGNVEIVQYIRVAKGALRAAGK